MLRTSALTLFIGLLLASAPAHAQASRTWVSGIGDDANPCSRTAPCKTFAGAISKTAAGGEINALDPGGFGGVTITKSITIDGGGGQIASVLAQGTNGIVVQAGVHDVVILRNLQLNGFLGNAANLGTAGLNGISFQTGASLFIDHCDIFGFGVNGIDIQTNMVSNTIIRNTTFRNVAVSGVSVVATAPTAVVTVVNSSFIGLSGLTSEGIIAGAHSVVSVTGSDLSNFSVALEAAGGGNLTVDHSTIVRSTTGVKTVAGSIANLTNNTFVNNVTAFTTAGTVASAQNNTIVGPLSTANASLPLK